MRQLFSEIGLVVTFLNPETKISHWQTIILVGDAHENNCSLKEKKNPGSSIAVVSITICSSVIHMYKLTESSQ